VVLRLQVSGNRESRQDLSKVVETALQEKGEMPITHSKSRTPETRQAMVAGRFYPASASMLRKVVQGYLDQASVPAISRVRALITPHAGFVCSGTVAGYGYRALDTPSSTDRYTIYLMGPAHWHAVHGIGLSSASFFQTPLGPVPVATENVEQLVALGEPFQMADAAHEPEHCLEVQLPFLQSVLPRFHIVPMLFGNKVDPKDVAAKLAPILVKHEQDLVVVSSDLSHFHPYAEAVQRDRAFLRSVVAGDLDMVSGGEACGVLPILCLMHLVQRLNWIPHLLHYCNSGDTCGSKNEVVGYGAVAYCAEPIP
jgi:AmmeMemoRadiSam system protein B